MPGFYVKQLQSSIPVTGYAWDIQDRQTLSHIPEGS